MAGKVAKPTNAQGEGGYTGYTGVQAVDTDIPDGFTAALVYRKPNGKFVDAYGREVPRDRIDRMAQKSQQVGTEEQKATTTFNAPLSDGVMSGTSDATEGIQDAEEDFTTDENEGEGGE